MNKRNYFSFGIGTIGRDMVYALITMYLIFYLTDVKEISNETLAWVTGIILFARVFDAFNDPVMGIIVDNTRSKYGKFKPWIAIGAFVSGIVTVLLFTDFHLSGTSFILSFAILYLLWGLSYTANDISYWSMLPTLSTNQKDREKIGSLARIFANIGTFSVVAAVVPLSHFLASKFETLENAYFIMTIGIVIILWLGQSVTLIGVKESRNKFKIEDKTTLKGMIRAIFSNDQLLYAAIAMVLFMTGYTTTTSFGIYFFKYAYGDENMFATFALVLGVTQLVGLIVFPFMSKFLTRSKLYTLSTIMIVVGYIIFFFSPMNILYIGCAGVLIFFGQAVIQILMLMFLSDTIEYGQWKLGKRNDSVTLSIQPFIFKLSGAIAGGIVGVTLILSGINEAKVAADVSAEGLLMMKSGMLLFPPFLMVIGYIVYKKKYIIDSTFYNKILSDLKNRGDIK